MKAKSSSLCAGLGAMLTLDSINRLPQLARESRIEISEKQKK